MGLVLFVVAAANVGTLRLRRVNARLRAELEAQLVAKLTPMRVSASKDYENA